MREPDRQERDELLARYVEGDLPADARRDVEQSLEASPEWRADLDLVHLTSRVVSRLPAFPSPGLWEGVRSTLAADIAAGTWDGLDWATRRVAPLVAGAAVLLVVAFSAFDSAEEQTSLVDYLSNQESSLIAETDLSTRVLPGAGE